MVFGGKKSKLNWFFDSFTLSGYYPLEKPYDVFNYPQMLEQLDNLIKNMGLDLSLQQKTVVSWARKQN